MNRRYSIILFIIYRLFKKFIDRKHYNLQTIELIANPSL